jgi:glucokinase
MSTVNLSDQVCFEQLLLRGKVSVPQLAETLNISANTALSVVGRMVKRGLARRGEDDAGGKRGRPAAVYALQLPGPAAAFKVDGTQMAGALFDAQLNLLARQVANYAELETPEAAAEMVRDMLAALVADAKLRMSDLPCAVVSIHALRIGRRTVSSSVLPWASDTMQQVFDATLPIPAHLTGMRNRFLLAEYQQWLELSPRSMAQLHVGDGISAHLFVGAQVYEGATSLAGELGHITIDPNGPMCGCGRRGCLEAICTGPAVGIRVIDELRGGVTSQLDWQHLRLIPPRDVIEQIWLAWCDGDSYARAVMKPILDQLGWGLGLVLNLLDPDLVTIGGYMFYGRQAWVDHVRQAAEPWTLHPAKRENRVEPSRATLIDELRVVAAAAYYPMTDGASAA